MVKESSRGDGDGGRNGCGGKKQHQSYIRSHVRMDGGVEEGSR